MGLWPLRAHRTLKDLTPPPTLARPNNALRLGEWITNEPALDGAKCDQPTPRYLRVAHVHRTKSSRKYLRPGPSRVDCDGHHCHAPK